MMKESCFAVDSLTQRDNFFTRMDARVKVTLSLAALVAVFAIPGVKFAIGLLVMLTGALVFLRLPLRLVMGRMIAPLVMGSVVFCLLLFFQSGHPLFSVHIWGLQLAGTYEGLALGTTILSRIAVSVSLLLLLSVTTPVHELGHALVCLKFPKVIVEILLLTYRYLFVLWDEGMRIKQAQTLRLGYPEGRGMLSWKHGLQSTSTLMGMVFIRAYDRAESTFNAMQVRSYNGNLTGTHYRSWNKSQTNLLVSGLVLLLVLLAVTI